MSVLIKGMEMPKSCYVCPAWWNGCNHQHDIFGYTEERPSDCPLVPVPPHGDLIDAQEQMRLMQSCEYDTYDDYSRAFDMLDNAPTIIPAEEGER